jgi:hypothetical protein
MAKNLTIILLCSLVNFVATPGSLSAGEIKARVVDGLGRPISNATVQVDLKETGADGKILRAYRLQMLSDRNGLVSGKYDDGKVSANDLLVYVSKTGYSDYSTGLREEYVLERKFGLRDLRRIARLTGEARKGEIRELLAGEYESKNRDESLEETALVHYQEFAPALRELLSDSEVGSQAAQLLCFFGIPDDMRLVVQQAVPPRK